MDSKTQIGFGDVVAYPRPDGTLIVGCVLKCLNKVDNFYKEPVVLMELSDGRANVYKTSMLMKLHDKAAADEIKQKYFPFNVEK